MPGRKPNRVSKMLSQKWPVRPTSKKTPKGGNRIANTILIGSVMVTAMRISFARDMRMVRNVESCSVLLDYKRQILCQMVNKALKRMTPSSILTFWHKYCPSNKMT